MKYLFSPHYFGSILILRSILVSWYNLKLFFPSRLPHIDINPIRSGTANWEFCETYLPFRLRSSTHFPESWNDEWFAKLSPIKWLVGGEHAWSGDKTITKQGFFFCCFLHGPPTTILTCLHQVLQLELNIIKKKKKKNVPYTTYNIWWIWDQNMKS